MIHAILLCLVVGVTDGDTLTARCPTGNAAHPHQQVKVRLAPIDAPEGGQAYGAQAKQALSRMVYRREVRLDCYKTDRYKRRICNVWATPPEAPGNAKTLDVSLAMVTQGMAWWYQSYAHEQSPEAREQYRFAEHEARARKAGLWADPHATPPWQWRKQRRGKRGKRGKAIKGKP